MTALLAGGAVLLAFGAIWELAGSLGERAAGGLRGALESLTAGRADSLTVRIAIRPLASAQRADSLTQSVLRTR